MGILELDVGLNFFFISFEFMGFGFFIVEFRRRDDFFIGGCED